MPENSDKFAKIYVQSWGTLITGSCLFRWAWPTPTISTSLGYKQSHEGRHACQLTWCTPRGMILYVKVEREGVAAG